MKRLVLIVSVLAVVIGAVAVAMQASSAKPIQEEAAGGEVAEATGLLLEVARVYREAPVLTDTISVTRLATGNSPTQTFQLTFAGQDVSFIIPGYRVIGVDGQMYLTRDDVANKVLVAPIEVDAGTTLRRVTGGNTLPIHFTLRSTTEIGRILGDLGMGQLQNPTIKSMSSGTSSDGRPTHQLLVLADNGNAEVTIDEASRLITDVLVTYAPANAPPGVNFELAAAYEPQVLEELPEPLVFDPGDRKVVADLNQLQPDPLKPGDEAPDFTLSILDGESVTLGDLRGSVVVLDFWATWCGPCKRALPLLEQFHLWAESSGRPVKVFAVNVWERHPDDQKKTDAVRRYWEQSRFTVPTLMDLRGTVAGQYEFRSIPTTIVVGPDGKVLKVHTGFDQKMVETLKAEALGALPKVSG